MNTLEILKGAKSEGKIVSIYVEPQNWDSFSLGFVDLIDDNYVRLKSLNKFGEFDGYEIRSLDEIIKIEMDGKYERKIDSLHKNFAKQTKDVTLSGVDEADLIVDAL